MRFIRVVTICMMVAGIAVHATPAFGQPMPFEAVSSATTADVARDEFIRGSVGAVVDEGEEDLGGGFIQPYRVLRVDLRDGEDATITQVGPGAAALGRVEPGDDVVVVRTASPDGVEYFIADVYRLPMLAGIALLFLALAALFGGRRGVTSVLGLAFSLSVLLWYLVPQIVGGASPLIAGLVSAFSIAFFSIYISHGLSVRTTVALAATLLTLTLAVVLAVAFVTLTRLTGLGSEEAFYLQLGLANVDMRGLLLTGIILGALGVLDDITTAQVASVAELRVANPSLGFAELYRRGTRIGAEHIASLVNTLALAYIGASLPMLLLFRTNATQPWWVILNGEMVAEEIIRTLVGSCALVVAVPASTLLAALVFSRMQPSRLGEAGEGHSHAH